jgi:hypothetical protein
MNEDDKLDINSADDNRYESSANTSVRDSDWPFLEDDQDDFRAGLKIDCDTADRITICNLKYHLDSIYDKETNHKVFGEFYHEEDKEYDRKLKKALKRVLKYFGEDVE